MEKKLKYNLREIIAINHEDILRMYTLMQDNYDYVLLENFKKDLLQKDYVGVLTDINNIIQGFTTYAINPKNYSSNEFNIMFSGDTVISENYTGSQALTKGWVDTVAFFIKKYPNKKLLWFLMSKGYKTYLYLPFFFQKYYPALEKDRNDLRLIDIINNVSEILYPNNWNKLTGIIKFNKKIGQIKERHISKSVDKNNKHVDFFIQKNPGYTEGDELVCMAEVNINNLMRFPKLILERSLRSINDNEK